MRLLWLLLATLLGMSAVSAQETGEWALQAATPLNELDEGMRYAALAPDGSAIAWGRQNELCVYGLAEAETNCYEIEDFRAFGRYSFVTWSPDSKTVSFNQSIFDYYYDGDIWTFDTEAETLTNRTDDGIREFPLGEENAGAMLDYGATWNPANGDLYFFRSQRIEAGDYTTELYLLPLSRSEPKLVRDLTAELPFLSVFRPAAISPNGEMMAMISLAQNPVEDKRSGIWTLNLKDGTLQQAATLADLQSGMPDWIEEAEYLLLPDTVAWAGDNGLVVTTTDIQYARQISQNAYYIDLEGGSIQALVDFSDIASADAWYQVDAEGGIPVMRMPRGGAVTPDGSAWVYVGTGRPATEGGTVWAVALPPDGSEPTMVGTIERYEVGPWAESQNRFTDDGSQAVIWGYVLEF